MEDWTPSQIRELAALLVECGEPSVTRPTLERLYAVEISIQQAIDCLRAELDFAGLKH